MFILTGCIGESLKIGPDISITVVGVKGVQARIGIAAPKEVRVQRGEIADKTMRDPAMPERSSQ